MRERVVQSLLAVGVTALIFSYAAAPPLVFAITPMFAWLAFRGTLREATLLLTGVGVVATLATSLGFGPVHELIARYAGPVHPVLPRLQRHRARHPGDRSRLTIVRAIVDLHGGEITVSSSEGIGTTVAVSLPKELAKVLEIPRAEVLGSSAS